MSRTNTPHTRRPIHVLAPFISEEFEPRVFLSASTPPIATLPQSIGFLPPVIADFDHDGIPDVAVGGGGTVTFYPGHADGTLGDPASTQFATGDQNILTLGRFISATGDRADILSVEAIITPGTDYTVSTIVVRVLAFSPTKQKFAVRARLRIPVPTYESYGEVPSPVVANLFGGPRDEFALYLPQGSPVRETLMLFAVPDGNRIESRGSPYSRPGISGYLSPVQLRAADFKGTGVRQSIVLLNMELHAATTNPHDGFITTSLSNLVGGELFVGDLDADGRDDLFSVGANGITWSRSIPGYRHAPPVLRSVIGTVPSITLGPGSQTDSVQVVAVGDVNGDGLPDLAMVNTVYTPNVVSGSSPREGIVGFVGTQNPNGSFTFSDAWAIGTDTSLDQRRFLSSHAFSPPTATHAGFICFDPQLGLQRIFPII